MGQLVRRLPLPRWTLPAGLAAVLALTGTAWGYWSAGGAGASSPRTGSMQAVSIAALTGGDAPGSSLLPGAPAADVILRMANPNAFPVHVASIASAGPITADTGHPGCTTTGVTFTPPANPAITVPANATLLVDLPAAASMDTSASPGCQGATFRIPVTAGARA